MSNELAHIVYNGCWGGFSLSVEAVDLYAFLKGIDPNDIDAWNIPRSDPQLAKIVLELGDKANGSGSALGIRSLPKGTRYRISEYDGMESVITEDEHEWMTA